ncbi:MAG: ZIP family metal transporter [Candidatus Omnitrophica bacterium]|nr:ZIP family metal transporter [Candidatus Omnitrophota bacterium]
MNFLWALGASLAVSLISLIGIFSLLLKEKLLSRILILLIGFSAGGLLGGAFLHLLPESLEYSHDYLKPFILVLLGFIIFFILEKYLYWRHCHEGKCEIHAFTYLNLIGDGIHNFIDGLIIGTSFVVDINIGIVTTFAIIMHEIPQELGDFGVLLYGGFSRSTALFFNFLSAATAILGTIVGYYFAHRVGGFSSALLPIAAGGFIYIAACDLIPELHKQPDLRKASVSFLIFLLGVGLMLWLKIAQPH